MLSKESSLRYFQYSRREKRDVNFSKLPIAVYPSESAHWSPKAIRQSGILSLNTRREGLAASREKQHGYAAYDIRTGCHKHAYYRVFHALNDTAVQY